jgi:hypothetical protein
MGFGSREGRVTFITTPEMENNFLKFFTTNFLLVFIASCASAPKQIYLNKDELSKINKVALSVSGVELDIRDARGSGPSTGSNCIIGLGAVTICLPLICLPMVVEPAGEYAIDKEKTREFRSSLGEHSYEEMLGKHFLDQLNQANFKSVNYSNYTSHNVLIKEGYDALIHLEVAELSLKRGMLYSVGSTNKKYYIYISVWGEMFDLEKGKLIWKKLEARASKEEHTLEEYKADEGEILNDILEKMFNKIAFRMAIDMI